MNKELYGMNKEKQVEELAYDLACKTAWDEDEIPTINCLETAKRLYAAGYCKQSEGEWKPQMQELGYCDTLECSICGELIDVSQGDYNYCPNCGSKMKGGAE